jgi:hypothetical protein
MKPCFYPSGMNGRTGIVTPYRHCPRHGAALELVFNEDWQENLSWWCSECRGEWSEVYFTMREEARLPLKAMSRRFILHCPECGSDRLRPSCPCCFEHVCQDCSTKFSPDADRLSPPTLAADELAKLAATVWLDENWDWGYLRPQLELLPQVVTERCCDRHPELVLSFAVDHATRDERMRFGWTCSHPECGGLLSPNYHHGDRWRTFFHFTNGPKFNCLSCNHVEFDQSEDLLKPPASPAAPVIKSALTARRPDRAEPAPRTSEPGSLSRLLLELNRRCTVWTQITAGWD